MSPILHSISGVLVFILLQPHSAVQGAAMRVPGEALLQKRNRELDSKSDQDPVPPVCNEKESILFADDFNSGTLSSEWVPIVPRQWIKDGWMHTRGGFGGPRDSGALVHDGDSSWTDYTVSLTADFVRPEIWKDITIILRSDGFYRSSYGSRGNGYEITFENLYDEEEVQFIRFSQRGPQDEFSAETLLRVPFPSPKKPFDVVASVIGPTTTLWVNGVLIFRFTDPMPLLYGGVGIHSTWEAESRIDNIVVCRHITSTPRDFEVKVDIQPYRKTNRINPTEKKLAVAILGSSYFDASLVDTESIRFGPSEALIAKGKTRTEDVNEDGINDLVLIFWLKETGLTVASTEACLTGATSNGSNIHGCDKLSGIPPPTTCDDKDSILFEDDFDSGVLSSDWVAIEPRQWIKNGWLHTKGGVRGRPRDSGTLVHDGDSSWRDYTVSLTADFVRPEHWKDTTIILRSDGFYRSSNGSRGNGYQITFENLYDEEEVQFTRFSQRGPQAEFAAEKLLRIPYPSPTKPFHVIASAIGDTITLWVDRTLIFNFTDPEPLLYGGVGIHSIWEAEARIDNVVVCRETKPSLVELEIDIQPNKHNKRIRLDGIGEKKRIGVAILGSPDFDASRLVNVTSVRFGPSEAKPLKRKSRVEDVNGDGIDDLVVRFRLRDTGLTPNDTEACISGMTTSGSSILQGCGDLRVLPPRE